jgi:hypothetical protein
LAFGLGFAAFALPLGALLFADALTLTAFLSDFAFGLEVFFFPLLEGFFLTFFNGSPASCDLEVLLYLGARAAVVLSRFTVADATR